MNWLSLVRRMRTLVRLNVAGSMPLPDCASCTWNVIGVKRGTSVAPLTGFEPVIIGWTASGVAPSAICAAAGLDDDDEVDVAVGTGAKSNVGIDSDISRRSSRVSMTAARIDWDRSPLISQHSDRKEETPNTSCAGAGSGSISIGTRGL